MFLRITTDPASRPNSLGELGIPSDSNPKVNLNEFAYKKGTEIYGEKEPADYVYNVKMGAVRSYKLLSDGRRQIGAFHLAGDIFGELDPGRRNSLLESSSLSGGDFICRGFSAWALPGADSS